MKSYTRPVRILVAEDDPDDRLLIKEALQEARLANRVEFVEDGIELMDRLRNKGQYAGDEKPFLPGLILLDLNMPRMDGREALAEIKGDPALRRIPVIALTTSTAEEDIVRSYDSGVSAFISKPVTFDGLVDVMRTVTEYWLQIVSLPQG